MEIVALQVLNSLFYAAVLFLIAAGLSLIFGVMGIVNMAHGSFYALGAYVTAWSVAAAAAVLPPALLFVFLILGPIAVAVIGLAIEPTLIRPFYRRPEEYQLLVTFGLLLVLDDVIRIVWGGTPLTASRLVDSFGLISIGGLPYPIYNLLMIGVGIVAALALWAFVYRTKFGVLLRATAQGRGARHRRRTHLRAGLRPGLFHGRARGCDRRSDSGRGARHGSGSAGDLVRRGRDRRLG